MNVRRRVDEVRLAGLLLTRLPFGRLSDPAPSASAAAWAFPLIGLFTGLIGWAVFAGAQTLGLAPMASAFASIAVTALATGAIHLDGLADFADGIGGGRDCQHALDIMKDSRVGSYGVLALVLGIGLQAAAIASTDASLILFLGIGVASRAGMVVTLVLLRPAREDGLGRTAANVRPLVLLVGGGLALCLSGAAGKSGALALLGTAAATTIVCVLARRTIKGQTGDVLGATQAASEAAGWLAASVVASPH